VKARAHPRYALEIDAEIRCEGQAIPARTRNISREGLSIVTERAVPVGPEITIAIALVFASEAMSESLPLRGRAVWCTKLAAGIYQIGVSFVGLTRDERSYVDLFIRYLEDQ